MNEELDLNKSIRARIGARIFIFRQRRGLTAEKLGELAGVAPNTIFRIENGEGCLAVTLFRLAMALGVELNEFFGN